MIWFARILLVLGCVAAVVGGTLWLMSVNPVVSEVVVGGLTFLATLVTSPFIMEASLAAMGLLVVVCYNQMKLDKEGHDEWVTLPAEEPEKTSTPEATEQK